jgi:hypothetical protein
LRTADNATDCQRGARLIAAAFLVISAALPMKAGAAERL